jgi:hypothetical protein
MNAAFNGGPVAEIGWDCTSSSPNYCAWTGVTCTTDNGQLISIQLINRGFTGSLPTQLGLLTGMTNLGLQRNILTGSIPTQLGLLTGMSDLSLFSNQLAGIIPTQLGLLTRMTYLNLFSNKLTGVVPSALCKLTGSVYLDYNLLTCKADCIPSSWVDPTADTSCPGASPISSQQCIYVCFRSL